MNYCQKGDTSDLWIIAPGDGFECLVCPLQEGQYDSWYGKTSRDLYHHLLDHVIRGHRVPLEVIERAQAEMEDKVWVSKAERFRQLLYKLAAPRTVFDFYVRAGRIIDLLDNMSDDDIEPLLPYPAWEWDDDYDW